MLAAGLDGIERKLELGKPVEENLYHFDDTMIRKQGVGMLPGSLEEALDEFANDEVIQTALGAHVCEWFMEAKRGEWNDYRVRVTPWELERYLMTY
jgi:glutamine synthetase